ncbi:hypothetical protein PybrP1_008247 [[Pythium] brassicae (nom. inval.)]|nr:hypothetical protein PybrP1_008247 [[Pythium] brassicae (nom. inval.)]
MSASDGSNNSSAMSGSGGGSVFLTEARVRNARFPAREINQMEPVVSGVSQMSQSTLLLKKRKEMREIDDALDFMKEEFMQRMEACDARERELERKQTEMKEQVARFEKFIKENDTKRTRAEIKTKTEHRLAEVNDQRKRQLLQQLEKDLKEREALEKKRDQLLKYRQYLEATVDASDGEYEEIGDILNRHATLVDTNTDLKGQVRSAEVDTDQLRQKIRALKVETQNLVLVQNSNIHGHQQQLETLRTEALKLDLDRQRNDRISNDRSRESGQIVMTVTNLYNRCRLSLGDKLPVLREQDMDVAQYIHSLLKVIASRIVDLGYIVSNYKEQSSSKSGNNSSANNSNEPSTQPSRGPSKAAAAGLTLEPQNRIRQLAPMASSTASSASSASSPTRPPPGTSEYPPQRRAGSFIGTAGYGYATDSLDKIEFASSSALFGAVDSAFSLAPDATTRRASPSYSGRRQMSSSPPPPSSAPSPAAAATADFDVMAQLASQYYTVSRNRSYSAPMPPPSLSWPTAGGSSVAAADAVAAPPMPQGPPPPPLSILTSADAHAVNAAGAIGSGVPSLRGSFISDLQTLHIGGPGEPENEPLDHSADKMSAEVAAALAAGGPLPATFLRTICDQLEFYFCDENLLGDLFLLKNMNMDGYVKLELLASFGRVKKLTTDMEQIKKALELSTKLLLNEDETMVCRKEPLAPEQTYHGKLARTAIAYNLPEDASVASLRETFQGCGEITYLRLLKKNTTTGRNAVLKPPIAAGETYAIIEFVDDEMTKHAVLTLSDQYNWRTGMQVVLFDGTNCDKLKQKMFPVELFNTDRRRAKSASHAMARPVHVEQVGEGLEDLREGKVNTGIVYSIRGAGGLITPTRQDSACISFRLIPDEDGNIDIRQGDYVSFTVGKNKKSGRKYASKVKLEFRPPASLTGASEASSAGGSSAGAGSSSTSNSGSGAQKEYFSPSPSRWEGSSGRNRAATVGAPPPPQFRGRSSSSGTRPKLNLSSPRMSSSPPTHSTLGVAGGPPGLAVNGSNPLYRQALGPDGTRGFSSRRTGEPEMCAERKFSQPMERRRSSSSGAALQPY